MANSPLASCIPSFPIVPKRGQTNQRNDLIYKGQSLMFPLETPGKTPTNKINKVTITATKPPTVKI